MTISVEDFVVFCRRTIGFHVDAVSRLDDVQVNQAPAVDGANTPFQLTTHALGAARWWTEHIVCGLPSDRDRDAEFTASGSVADLVALAATTVERIEALAPDLDAATDLAHEARTSAPLEGDWTVGAALLHTYEELAQHLGHLELTVDLVLAGHTSP